MDGGDTGAGDTEGLAISWADGDVGAMYGGESSKVISIGFSFDIGVFSIFSSLIFLFSKFGDLGLTLTKP